jgi:hypothetical protein
MSLSRYAVLIGMFVAGCEGGGEVPQPDSRAAAEPAKKKDASPIDACALLTPEEIEAAAGWKPAQSQPKAYQTTATCTYQGPKPLTQTVVLVVARPAPKVTSSTALAERRSKEAQRHPELKLVYAPVEGLGVPAVEGRSEGSGPTLEAAVNGLLLSLTTSSLEASKALAAKAIPRLP